MTLGLLFVLMCMMISGGARPFWRNNGASSSRLKGKKVDGGQSSVESCLNENDYEVVDGFYVVNYILLKDMLINYSLSKVLPINYIHHQIIQITWKNYLHHD